MHILDFDTLYTSKITPKKIMTILFPQKAHECFSQIFARSVLIISIMLINFISEKKYCYIFIHNPLTMNKVEDTFRLMSQVIFCHFYADVFFYFLTDSKISLWINNINSLDVIYGEDFFSLVRFIILSLFFF